MSSFQQHYGSVVEEFLQIRATSTLDPATAKQMGLKVNEFTANPSEVDRFCLGVAFLSWPFFNAGNGVHDIRKFLSVSAAKQLLVSVTESVVLRVTKSRAPKTKASSTSKKKKKQGGGSSSSGAASNGAELTGNHFHAAVNDECRNCFLACFDSAAAAAIPTNTRRMVQFCIGALLTINCALGDRGSFTPGSIPWPNFHQVFLPILDGTSPTGGAAAVAASAATFTTAVTAWEFMHEFVSSFQKHGVLLPNLVGYAAELMSYGIEKRADSHVMPACANVARNLSSPSPTEAAETEFLNHLFQSAALLCTMNPGGLFVQSHFDRGGNDRQSAVNALATFVGACAAVTDALAFPLATLLAPLPAALLRVEDEMSVPPEFFELLLNAVECLRGLLARENGVLRAQREGTFAATSSLFLLVGALGQRFASACRDEVRACACTAMTALTEMLDNAETAMFDAVLRQQLPADVAQASGESATTVGEWFVKHAVLDWLLVRKEDTSLSSDDAYRSLLFCEPDFAVPDNEREVMMKLRGKREKKSDDNKSSSAGNDDDDNGEQENKDDDNMDDEELARALMEDGIAKSPVRQCALDLFGALSTALPVSTAPVVFRVCTQLIEQAGAQVAGDNNSNAAQNEAAAVLEAAFVGLSEIIDETFHVLRQNDECMASLLNNVFRVAACPAIAKRPGVLSSSLRLAGMVALACGSAAARSGQDDSSSDDEDEEEEEDSQKVSTTMSPDQLRTIIGGAQTMLRHLILHGVNSPFKRCNWTATNIIAHYARALSGSLYFTGDDDDDDDDQEDEKVIRNKKNSNSNGRSARLPKSEIRENLFPAAAEDAVLEILFAGDGNNWVNTPDEQQRQLANSGSAASFSSRAAAFLQSGAQAVTPLPLLQLLSRTLAGELSKSLVQLDMRSARYYQPQQRSQHLAVPRFARAIINCVRRGWSTRPAENTMELTLYVEMLRHLAPVLAIPFYNADTQAFCAPLELVAGDIREACVSEMKRVIYNDGRDDNNNGSSNNNNNNNNNNHRNNNNAEWRDTVVSLMCDALSDMCDNLALSTNRLVALQRMNFKVSSAFDITSNNIVNPAAAQLILTEEVMELASTLAARTGCADLRRCGMSLLADFAAAHFWWRTLTVVSCEAVEAAELPMEDREGGAIAERELPPPCVSQLTPALQRLQGFCGKVLQLCFEEMQRFVNYDPDSRNGNENEEEEEDDEALATSASNALWCLSCWIGAAAGPPQHTAAVAQHFMTNPNAQFLRADLPTAPENLLGLLALLMARSHGISSYGSMRDNALAAALRLATVFPQALGPLSTQPCRPLRELAGSGPGVHNIMAYIQNKVVGAAIAPIAADCVSRMSSSTERQEALQRIGALATCQVNTAQQPGGGGETANTFMFSALRQMPAATVDLAAAVRKDDLPSTIGAWDQIIRFVAAIDDSAVREMLREKKGKLRAAFGLHIQ